MLPTTRVVQPNVFRINDGSTDYTYEIAQNRNDERLWADSYVPVQPGQGELVKTWDSWHMGMGWSRDESKTSEYAPPVYESGRLTATHRGFIYPEIDVTLTDAVGVTVASFNRIAEMGGYTYLFGTVGTDIFAAKFDSTGALKNTKTFTGWTAPAGQPVEFGGYLYVPSAGGLFKELTTIASGTGDDTWTDGPATRRAWHLCTAGKLLWRVGDASTPAKRYVVNSCSAVSSGGSGGPLTAGNWSDTSDYVIGKPGRNINSLGELGRWLHVGKDEGLFYTDADGNQANALDFTRNLISSYNCVDMIRWLGTLVTIGSNGTTLWQYTGASSRPIGIETLEGNLSAIKGGRYVALAAAGMWLYAAYRVGAVDYILAGRPGHEDEPAVIWHPLTAQAAGINALLVSSLATTPWLWLCGELSANRAGHMTLAADGSPDPTDTNIAFETSQAVPLDLPATDWGMPGTLKKGHMVEVVTGQARGAGGSVYIYYGWDGAAPSTQLGAVIAAAGLSRRFWTAGTTDSGYRPQIRVTTVGNTNTLRIEKVSLYCVALPRMEPVIETTVRLADNLDKKRTKKQQYAHLKALVHSGIYTVYDPDDPAGAATYKVYVDNVHRSKGEQIERQPGEDYARITMRVVEYA